MSNKRKLKEMQVQLDKLQAHTVRLTSDVSRLIVKVCEPQPKLKVLDQSVFDGQDKSLILAFVHGDGSAMLTAKRPTTHDNTQFYWDKNADYQWLVGKYDATNWQNSLIERDKVELTGSDLAKDYFNRGCCPRICFVGEDNDECLSDLVVAMVIGYDEQKGFETSYHDFFPYAALVNSYGDELTASEVGA